MMTHRNSLSLSLFLYSHTDMCIYILQSVLRIVRTVTPAVSPLTQRNRDTGTGVHFFMKRKKDLYVIIINMKNK